MNFLRRRLQKRAALEVAVHARLLMEEEDHRHRSGLNEWDPPQGEVRIEWVILLKVVACHHIFLPEGGPERDPGE